MIDIAHTVPIIGVVVSPKQRPATPTDVWIELLAPGCLALRDLVQIESPGQHLLGTVVEMERVMQGATSTLGPRERRASEETTLAKLAILSSSDGLQRPPDGTAARLPSTEEVTTLLGESRQIPRDQRVPLAVVPIRDQFAPVYGDLHRLAGRSTVRACRLESEVRLGIRPRCAKSCCVSRSTAAGNVAIAVHTGREFSIPP